MGGVVGIRKHYYFYTIGKKGYSLIWDEVRKRLLKGLAGVD